MNNKYARIMILCCLVPAAAGLAVIILFRVPVLTVLFVAMVVVCPIAHILMMRSMGHDHGDESHAEHVHAGPS